MANKIVIPYKPRPIWASIIHPALESHRFSVLVCHRRFGKTVGCVNHLIKMGVTCKRTAPNFAYVAPFRNQAKLIAWQYLKHYTHVIPGMSTNESELFVEFPSTHPGWQGARIYIIGADHPDALRGIYLDGVVLDEYANIKRELWDEVLRPALADREGWAVFIGTPAGQNQFFEVYQRAQREPDWFSCMYRVDESGVLPEAEVADMKRDMTEMAIRQELYCDFSASAEDIVIPIDLVTEASSRTLTDADVRGQPVVLGVDVARFGDDRTVITARKGLWCQGQHTFRGLDTMAVAERVIDAMRQYEPDATFVDVGAMGAGVVDRLHQLGYAVTEVNFAAASSDERYANKRAEMYFNLRSWMMGGGSIPNEPDLKSELSIVEYHFTPAGKIQLEPKDKIKEKIGKSPDVADSLALTFALPVMPQSALTNKRMMRSNTNYKLF